MKALFDTSSLVSFVRYYYHFDKDKILHHFIEDKTKSGEILLIDKVLDESKGIQQGIVHDSLPFLWNNSICKSIKTTELFANNHDQFLKDLDNRFLQQGARRRLEDDSQYEKFKKEYLENADCKLIIYGKNYYSDKKKGLFEECEKDLCIVTEETKYENDGKLFKKIPAICKELNIPCINIREYLEHYIEINYLLK